MNRPVGDTALARCVACPADVFAERFWGRQPLLSPAQELTSGFDDLFSADAVDELSSERGLRTPFLRMAREGVVKPNSTFTRGGGAGAGITDQAADDKITRALDEGATLVLQGLHRTWPPLVDLGARLADEIGHPVQINAYITPPGNQGFAAHHDTHDVFVLQITGTKQWTVHAPVLQDPLDNQPFDHVKSEIAARTSEPPLIDTVLSPGDALYLPRGTVHSAVAQGETSIHLTIGIHPLTRYQLVRFICDAVIDSVELRRSLPMGVDLSDPDVLGDSVAETVTALHQAIDIVSVEQIAQRVGENLRDRTRPVPVSPLAQMTLARTLTIETSLRLRAALRITASADAEPAEGTLTLGFLDRELELPAGIRPALQRLAARESLTPADLGATDDRAALDVARHLIIEGVLVAG